MSEEANSELRQYAEQEDGYILSLLLRPEDYVGGCEEPLPLAERNCGATERQFGASDPLHAMALNTLAFVRLRQGNAEVATGSAAGAVEILTGRGGEEELLLEARCLLTLARGKTGSPYWLAFAQTFEVPLSGILQGARMAVAGEALSDLLEISLGESPLRRVVAQLAMRDLAWVIVGEVRPRRFLKFAVPFWERRKNAVYKQLWDAFERFLAHYF